MSTLRKNNVQLHGSGAATIIFVHGFGCDQTIWRLVAPAFAQDHRLVLFDHIGAGRSDSRAYDYVRYDSLQGYAGDLEAVARECAPDGSILIGHSVGATIAMLAAIGAPELFRAVIMLSPSPCYLNDGDYSGGFARQDIEELLDLLDVNQLGWSSVLARTLMRQTGFERIAPEPADGGQADPNISRHFARVTFLSDHRGDLPRLRTPSLIMQACNDLVAPEGVGHYMAARIPDSTLMKLQTSGHCPHLSDPAEVIVATRRFLASRSHGEHAN